MPMEKGPYYAVTGDRVLGPFHVYGHAKQALKLPANTHSDEIVVSGSLYRYGSSFVGTEQTLVQQNIMGARSGKPPVQYTHMRITFGIRDNSVYVRPVKTTDWIEIK